MKARLTLALGLLAARAAFGADGGSAHHGRSMNSAQTELGADAAFDRQGMLWAVHKVSGHIAISRSEDRGRSWENPVLVTPGPEPTDAGGDARPKIALGPKGEVYLTWTRPLSKPYTGEVRFSRSLDEGRTFSPPVVVHRDRQEITHRFDALAVDEQGRVFVAWIDKRDAVAASKDAPYRGAAIYFAVSSDRGATFAGDFKVAEHSCECCRIALTRAPDGDIVALWRHVFEPNIRDHALATLHADGTVSGFRRATFDDWRIDVCPHHGPGLGADADGRLHAVWHTGAPQDPGVFYARLDANGPESRRRVGGETAEHADLAATGRRVGIAWKEFDGERTRLRGMVSEDGGESWLERDLSATDGASGHPRVLAFDGRFYVLWNTASRPLGVLALP
ncbi:hypothetical protein DB347_05060 [Opitutaceae bacterium EW11]|nr:hypothetical protein DB347_05060 [Opitutaceae bacterium EW11]